MFVVLEILLLLSFIIFAISDYKVEKVKERQNELIIEQNKELRRLGSELNNSLEEIKKQNKMLRNIIKATSRGDDSTNGI